MWERSTFPVTGRRFLGHQLISIKDFYFLKNRELVLTTLVSPRIEVGLAFNRRSVNVFE